MNEQRLYLPSLGLVVVLRPIPAENRAFVGATMRIELIDPRTAGGRTHLRVKRIGPKQPERGEGKRP